MDSDDDFGSEDDELELGVQEGDEEEESIQLGFLAPYSGLLSRSSWGAWDGGKVGGRPVWLDPRELPLPSCLVCLYCEEPLSFLLQVLRLLP